MNEKCIMRKHKIKAIFVIFCFKKGYCFYGLNGMLRKYSPSHCSVRVHDYNA